jgi:DNA-binding LacI/PurR family transcriptional regulator
MPSVVRPGTTPTLHAVALRSGVSVSTASRCLSGAAKMANSTQLRVFAAASEIGYKHNALVGQVMRATRRGEAQNHLGTIAFVTPVADSHEWRATPTLQSNWEAARERAESFGYGITEFTLCSNGMTGQRLGGILSARGITGALLAAFPTEPHTISFPWNDFAIVQVGHQIESPQLDCVLSDHSEAVTMAAKEIAQCGYSRIGLAIETYQDHITDSRWSLGYAGLSVTMPSLAKIPPLLPTQMTRDLFLEWVNKYRVDCVLTLSTFRNEPNVMDCWLEGSGLSVPKDVGLVSLDVTRVHSDWSGVRQHSEEIGRAAVDMLFSKLQAGERGIPQLPRTLQVHGHWHDGGTLRPPIEAKAACEA